MESTICMNELCRGATSSSEWKKGWSLKSGGFAKLCYNCGSAYENVAFCEMFHLDESGWRKCRTCGKHIHCGCIASKYLYEYMDYGGIGCVSCVSRLGNHALRSVQPIGIENRVDGSNSAKGKLLKFSNAVETCESVQHLGTWVDDNIKQEKRKLSGSQVETCLPNLNACESFDQPSNFSLNTPVNCSSSFNGGREQNMVSPLHQGQSVHHMLPKQPKASQNHDSKLKGGTKTQTNIVRPPAEGRGGRARLLPRYQSKITDQELQQISGDLKSTVVPLFDKVLTASDAGRIGRLVLPKACAEAYFPSIDQSEGLPITIQDITGKEWTFLFRFWLNNNSRMYVLEGVTPCIRSMQLQAGDTVTFSRIDPGGKLVMSFRKGTNNGDTQTKQLLTVSVANNGWMIPGLKTDNSSQSKILVSQKKTQNIGSKRKRFLMQVEDAIELRITMEEAQDLFCPPPSLKPTILTIDDIEFEAYHEPPVFGKATISVPDEINQTEPDTSLRVTKGSKRQKVITEKTNDREPSGLDALNTDTVAEDNTGGLGKHSVGATTKHPRHHPGCACIVCIQPPSGTGKHQPNCDCNICSTLRRRLNTFNQRKKKRQSDHETELAVGKDKLPPPKDASERDTANEPGTIHMNHSENNIDLNRQRYPPMDVRSSQGQLDLNCHPSCEDDLQVEVDHIEVE
nr:B3 domain-containing transcription repressor VAL1-like [Ipomoea batatas]